MANQKINILSQRYAKALLEIILEMGGEKIAQTVEHQLDHLSKVLVNEEIATFFKNPTFDQEEKKEILAAIFRKISIDPALERFLEILISLGHMNFLPEISKRYAEAAREKRNEVQAHIKSAFPLNETQRNRLAKALSSAVGKKVLMNIDVTPELLGGVVAEVGGVIYDASIQGYLSRLQEEFSI